jgi:hypothetical protein
MSTEFEIHNRKFDRTDKQENGGLARDAYGLSGDSRNFASISSEHPKRNLGSLLPEFPSTEVLISTSPDDAKKEPKKSEKPKEGSNKVEDNTLKSAFDKIDQALRDFKPGDPKEGENEGLKEAFEKIKKKLNELLIESEKPDKSKGGEKKDDQAELMELQKKIENWTKTLRGGKDLPKSKEGLPEGTHMTEFGKAFKEAMKKVKEKLMEFDADPSKKP